MPTLEVRDLYVSVDGKEILRGLNFAVNKGEVHALMGPNGSGKSTLAYTIMGHPKYKVEGGDILFEGKSILEMKPDERAKLGLFLAFQYPVEVPGVTLFNFLWKAIQANNLDPRVERTSWLPKSVVDYKRELIDKIKKLNMSEIFVYRPIGVGFSGGEKKRMEILQMAMLKPIIAFLDEPDSGLDIDSLKIVADVVNSVRTPELGIVMITHYQRILNYIKPDFVHIMLDGRIVKSGGPEIVEKLEQEGYAWIRETAAESAN
ncbi:Fe-S cluster assembly ATPase SufC [Candidatus Kryptobacter tengchongensis]|uniref:Fe-S cluster assembly ATP-binding protein n=1 Tax=Kryptobacter tengchongensis TaxID=1643429 RepID=A0A656D9V2_KRYT1|nr:Fe-S cluster assembly ATPase SufC [Candidatus Kryptobacter tengchongensis]CUT04359.1 Fe-S cluster assembly ATP-binding protein [Candidatus Kryptobacter tengchongensis]